MILNMMAAVQDAGTAKEAFEYAARGVGPGAWSASPEDNIVVGVLVIVLPCCSHLVAVEMTPVMPDTRRARILASLALLALAGCSTYLGGSRPLEPSELAAPGWIIAANVPHIPQRADLDCGAAALASVLVHWRAVEGIDEVLAACPPDPERGIEAGALREFAKKKGLEAFLIEGDFKGLRKELAGGGPCSWACSSGRSADSSRFEVVVGYHPGRKLVATLDPSPGRARERRNGILRERVGPGKAPHPRDLPPEDRGRSSAFCVQGSFDVPGSKSRTSNSRTNAELRNAVPVTSPWTV